MSVISRCLGRAIRPKSAGAGLAAVAAMLAAATISAVTSAPNAVADVSSLTASPGISWGPSTPYGTNCTYTLTATVTYSMPVSFYDFNTTSTFAPGNYIAPTNNTATVQWTPTQPGWHHIVAYQTSAGGPAIDLIVGTGINTGSACVVPS